MNSNDFNHQYKLTQEFINKIKLAKDKKNSNSIAGKPKILAIEVIKRFFKNPAVLIAFITFIALMIAAVVITTTSPLPAVKKVDFYWQNEYKTTDINSLPPIFKPIIETSNGSIIHRTQLMLGEKLNDGVDFSKYLKDYITDYEKLTPSIIKLNYYNYWDGAWILGQLTNAQSRGETITPALVAEVTAKLPNFRPIFGTTELGVDIWTTVWKGALESIWVALVVASIETLIGVFVGAYLGFHAGKSLDTFMMRIIEIFQSPPSIIWLLMFVSIWGPSNIVLILGLLFVGWTWPIGTTRMFIITVKDEEYIIAAKSVGASTKRQIFMHALPAIIGKLAMNYVRRIPSIILTIASLAFLGFYQDSNSANLGYFMINNTKLADTNPWVMILPATILLTLSLSLQFIAVGLHDALDPRVIKTSR
ncbi:ABC transporter permease [Mycoplasmopsis lipofaciens]|uniref:ABC transporter permease n=1 Tax=Mycoplasmopsis lipofaciens TaxID=114884 RepID=UPI00048799D9|nr:ABC transporter permease [Mycoplasmopsis lipofaciens]